MDGAAFVACAAEQVAQADYAFADAADIEVARANRVAGDPSRLRELRDTTGIRRRELTRKLAETEARIKKTVEALIDGIPSRALKERLAELERERDVAELAIAELSPPPLEIHPNAAESYRQKVQNLKAAIDKADACAAFANWSKRS